jgi:hypothetical protein
MMNGHTSKPLNLERKKERKKKKKERRKERKKNQTIMCVLFLVMI